MTRTLYAAILAPRDRQWDGGTWPPLMGIPFGTQSLGLNFLLRRGEATSSDQHPTIMIHFTGYPSHHRQRDDEYDPPKLPYAWITNTSRGISVSVNDNEIKNTPFPLRDMDEVEIRGYYFEFRQGNRVTKILQNQDIFREMWGPFTKVIDPTATRWCLTCLGLSSGPHAWQNGSTIMPTHSAVASAPESREAERGVSTRREGGRVEDSGRREDNLGGGFDNRRAEDGGRVEAGGRREEGRGEDGGRREEGRVEDGGRREEGRVEDGGRREEGRVEDGGRREEGRVEDGGRREEGRGGDDIGAGGRENVVQVESSESDRRSVRFSLGKRPREEEASATDEMDVADPQREQDVMNNGDAASPHQKIPPNPRRGATDDTVDVPRKVKKPRITDSLPTRRSARLEAKTPRYQLRERGRPSTIKSNSVSAHINEKVNDLEKGKGKRKRSPGGIGEGRIKKRWSTTTKDSDPENKSSSKRKRSPGGVSGKATKKRRSTNTKDPAPEDQEALQYSITNFTPPLREQKGAKGQDGLLGESILSSPNTPPITDDPYQLSSPCPIPTTSSFITTKLHPSPATSPPRPPQLHRSTSAPPM
ncbi:hypothetical protein BJ684DRAFT_17479 [Piptocephalis cylindrospora]|uniref:FHA domain-containing protein n=1 Tax=Piptocephalis cylindrospora TaxID=1907219 RepID=A0A4V1IXR6_9FUNG|nr:hypothetical protein BJ684DRAFT_17479 [Piptocephalis cylindrospora]|eukprot:RKP11989.1 hypothetical protein BJ684DRAFT_17479 [Piptocephalis cylindrospora]